MLIKNFFSIEMQEIFEGWYDPERDWNGWKCPSFDWSEAVRIAEWLNEWSGREQLIVDFEREVIISQEDIDAPFNIEGVDTETEEGVINLYGVGTGQVGIVKVIIIKGG